MRALHQSWICNTRDTYKRNHRIQDTPKGISSSTTNIAPERKAGRGPRQPSSFLFKYQDQRKLTLLPVSLRVFSSQSDTATASRASLSKKQEELVLTASAKMEIPLGTANSNPIDFGTNAVTKGWAGFIKVYLLNSQKDGILLLNGHRVFIMQMEDGEKVIDKIEKWYESVTNARNLRLHFKGETLRHEHTCTIFESLVQESFYKW